MPSFSCKCFPARALAFTGLLAVFLLFALTAPAHAHRVNVFGWVEGSTIQAEATFSNGRPAMDSDIRVENPATGAVAAKGKTDAKGAWSTPVPDFAAEHGARLVIDSGGGHRGEWMLETGDFVGQQNAATHTRTAATEQDAAQASATAAEPDIPEISMDSQALQAPPGERLEERIERAVERAVTRAMNKAYAREHSGPGMTEILGGLGWIFGLMGVAAYFKYRKN